MSKPIYQSCDITQENSMKMSGGGDWFKPPSEVEEWLILVQSGYYNNPVPAYFSTSHLLILIQTRINISRLWTIISQVVDYYKPGFGLL